MASKILLVVGVIVGFGLFSVINGLYANIRKARKTGLPYIVVRKCQSLPLCLSLRRSLQSEALTNSYTNSTACSPYNALWQISHKLCIFLIKLLPKSMWEGWLLYVSQPLSH